MIAPRGGAGMPMFLRIFLLMLACVAVVQLMNLVVLVAMQTPSAKLYTVSDVVDTMEKGKDPSGALRLARVPDVERTPWNPRAERIELAIAKALETSPERVRVRFIRPILQREPIFDRSAVPPSDPPPTREAARDVVVMGAFKAAWQQPDGTWLRVDPAHGFEAWRWLALLWLIVSVAAVAPFAWELARRFAKPIGAFAAAAERLGRDPRAAPIELHGPSEIAEAAAAFNRMQSRLNRYVDDRTMLIGAVAHDLRTPLMRLALRLEPVPEKLRLQCEADIRDMQALIAAALSYVRDATKPAVRRPLDLRSLCESVIDDLSDRGEPVTLAQGAPVVVEGDSAALKAMLTNLVSNALKYAGATEVSLARIGDNAEIVVSDAGPGIPPNELEHVFEPFFRGERSRNRDTGGIGLGLASARAVARAHGGEVTLENRADGGLVAKAVLPA